MSTSRENRPNSPTRRRIAATLMHHYAGTCAVRGCGRTLILGGDPRDGFTFQLGHVVSDANGGAFRIDNLVPLCRRCNVDAGDQDIDVTKLTRAPEAFALLPDPGNAERNMTPGPLAH